MAIPFVPGFWPVWWPGVGSAGSTVLQRAYREDARCAGSGTTDLVRARFGGSVLGAKLAEVGIHVIFLLRHFRLAWLSFRAGISGRTARMVVRLLDDPRPDV